MRIWVFPMQQDCCTITDIGKGNGSSNRDIIAHHGEAFCSIASAKRSILSHLVEWTWWIGRLGWLHQPTLQHIDERIGLYRNTEAFDIKTEKSDALV